MSGDGHTKRFADVRAAEAERIAQHRAARGVRGGALVGLALSGGGIRAGSFALGVMQALDAAGAFRLVDYLSTVSGGGYTGTMLTWLLRDGARSFPFAAGGHDGALDRLRRQVDYLSPTARLTLGALLAVVLQHAFLSLAVYGGLLVGFFFLLDVADQALRPVQALAAIYAIGPWTDWMVLHANTLLLASAAGLLAFLALALLPAVFLAWWRWRWRGPEVERKVYLHRRQAVRHSGALLRFVALTFVVGTVPLAADSARGIAAVLGGAILLGLLAAWRRQPAAAAALWAFALLYGFLLVTHAVAMAILFSGSPWLIFVVVGGALVLGAITSLGAHGSAGVYRDRLAETFLPDPRAMGDPSGRAARHAATYPLADACGPATIGPYQLLNAALLTPASRATRARQRGADAFVFSPLYCGSEPTGWRATPTWARGGVTLAAAMATSAAAVDPHTAVAGAGTTRGLLVSLVLALLGLRLGRVAPNPADPPPRRARLLPPNLLVPGIAQALLGELTETGRYVTLADGGDFENLGVYELVRRRLDVIVAVDASEDERFAFAALGNLIERVRVDFGVDITCGDLAPLAPSAAADGVGVPTARRAHALGRIHYPACGDDGPREGVFCYLKATMLAGVPIDVLAHAALHPAFPQESTFDQCFDEARFEAYRLLGAVAADRLLADRDARQALAAAGIELPAALPLRDQP